MTYVGQIALDDDDRPLSLEYIRDKVLQKITLDYFEGKTKTKISEALIKEIDKTLKEVDLAAWDNETDIAIAYEIVTEVDYGESI